MVFACETVWSSSELASEWWLEKAQDVAFGPKTWFRTASAQEVPVAL